MRDGRNRQRVEDDHEQRRDRWRDESEHAGGPTNGEPDDPEHEPENRWRKPARRLVETKRQCVVPGPVRDICSQLVHALMECDVALFVARAQEDEVVLGR